MPFGGYLILVQNLLLSLLVIFPVLISCKGKKGGKKNAKGSTESGQGKPKSPDIGTSQSGIKDEGKKDGDGANESKEGDKKDEDKKDGEKKDSADQSKETSQKPFPKFEMPTESKKKAKIQENEVDKKEKIKKGFYQQKSDEDDTLEKVDSLHVEQSEKTKRSQKKKNKK